MSLDGFNFSNKKGKYQINIKIISVDLNDEKNKPKQNDLSVVARFAEKSMEIGPGLDETSEVSLAAKPPRSSEKPKPDNAQRKTADKKNLENRASENRKSSNAKDLENRASENRKSSDAKDLENRKSGARRTEKFSENDESAKNRPSRNSNVTKSGKSNATTSTNLGDDEQSVAGNTLISRRSTTKFVGSEKEFGSLEETFEVTPNYMATLLAHHCFKYEILKDSQLYATTNQLLNECFANAIRTEEFSADNVNMKLVLMQNSVDPALKNRDCGTMDICLTVKKLDEDVE